MIADLLTALYLLIVAILSIYGLLGFVTLSLFWWHRNEEEQLPEFSYDELPRVTVQLPIYNERLVVARLIDAAAALNYPRDRLQIQVVDDSDDDTVEAAAALVRRYQERGLDITHLVRAHRQGYKAGALAAALEQASGDYVAIFDADFQPQADFLLDTIPYFAEDPSLGMIQARWGHLNAAESPLTAAQSIALDKHFVMEQTVRHRARMFPKFNGSAGVWRRACVVDAGGWQSDTVCEDLCLSTRAILKGWEFRYLDDVVAPAELPADIRAYKNQQARWAKGSIQCLQKYGSDILRDADHSLTGRIYALLSMSAYSTHLLLLLLLLLQLPMLLLDVRLSPFMLGFTIIGIGQPLLFVAAQKETYPDWRRRLLHFPTLLLVAVGMAPSNTRAIFQALQTKRDHPFIRTPKGSLLSSGDGRQKRPYVLPRDGTLWLEILLAFYAAAGISLAVYRGHSGPLFLLFTSLLGFAYVIFLEIRDIRLVARQPLPPH